MVGGELDVLNFPQAFVTFARAQKDAVPAFDLFGGMA